MNKLLLATIFCILAIGSIAQNVYKLTLPSKVKPIYGKHLKMGRTSPSVGSIDVNSY